MSFFGSLFRRNTTRQNQPPPARPNYGKKLPALQLEDTTEGDVIEAGGGATTCGEDASPHHCSRCARHADLVRLAERPTPRTRSDLPAGFSDKFGAAPVTQTQFMHDLPPPKPSVKIPQEALARVSRPPSSGSITSMATLSYVQLDEKPNGPDIRITPSLPWQTASLHEQPASLPRQSVSLPQQLSSLPQQPAPTTKMFITPQKKSPLPERKLNFEAAPTHRIGGRPEGVEVQKKSKLEERLERLAAPRVVEGEEPVPVEVALTLKTITFGSALKTLPEVWRSSGFPWMEEPRWGLRQSQRGIGAVVCTVQAEIIRYALFERAGDLGASGLKRLPSKARAEAMSSALSAILWRAGGQKSASFCSKSATAHLEESSRLRRDGVTEFLTQRHFTSLQDLKEAVFKSVSSFDTLGSSGVLLLLYSAVLSRGISNVSGDMDFPEPLVTHLGDCSMGCTNLLLSGRASNHVFNSTLKLDNDVLTLRGVHGRCDIGLLSDLSGGMDTVEVGSFLKVPRTPIWLVIRAEKFCLIFCTVKDLVNDWKCERRFELTFYNPQASSSSSVNKPVQLQFDTTDFGKNDTVPGEEDEEEKELSQLELAFKMKWPDAAICWPNGVDKRRL